MALSIHSTKDIDTIGKKKSMVEKCKEYSLFGTRFGVYIGNSTRYVGKFGFPTTIFCIIILVWIVIVKTNLIGTVAFCSNMSHLYFKNMRDLALDKYNV